MPPAASSSSPRIAWDATVVRPPLSGVHLSVRAELLAMLELEPAPSGVLFALSRELRQHAEPMGVETPRLSPQLRHVAPRILWQQCRLPSLLRRHGVQVLHATAYTAPLRCPVPVVLNVHDIIALEHPELCSRLNAWHMRLLLPGSIRRATINVATTHHVADRMRCVLGTPAERIEVVPLGVDADHFANPAMTIPDQRPYLLFVGNIEPKKGLATLLDAYARVADSLKLDLMLVGRPGWRCEGLLDRLRSWCGPGRILLAGRVSDEELVQAYRGATAFVFPSICEGFGMPVLEAMAAGVPVIHSDHPAVGEVAGGAGIRFAVGDSDALAAALRRLHSSPTLRDQTIAAGRQRAAELTWQRRATALLSLLHAASERRST